MNTPIKSYNLDPNFNNINYNTARECGVYMFSYIAAKQFYTYPIFVSIPQYTNFTNSTITSGIIPLVNGNGGVNGAGRYQNLDVTNVDEHYIVHPNYGIITWNSGNYTGGYLIDYENLTNTTMLVGPPTGNTRKAESIQVYYKGVLLT